MRSFKTWPLKFTILITHMVNIFFQVFEQCSNFRFFIHQKCLYWCSLWLQLWKCANRFGVISCNQGVRWLIFNSGISVIFSYILFLWCLRPLSTIFSYIVAVSFIGGGNRSVGENHCPVSSHWQTLLHNVVSSTLRTERDSISQLQWW